MGFGNGRQPPRHRRRPVRGSQRGQVKGNSFGAGRESTECVLLAPAAEVIPIGPVGAEGRGRFRRADKLRGLLLKPADRWRRHYHPNLERTVVGSGTGRDALPRGHCSSASSAARSSSRASARASAGDKPTAELTGRTAGTAGRMRSPGEKLHRTWGRPVESRFPLTSAASQSVTRSGNASTASEEKTTV